MGLVKGAVSYRRYVVGDPPELGEGQRLEDYLCARLRQFGFREIDPSTEIEQSIGWVRHDDAFDSTFAPDDEPLRSAALLLMRMRIDTLKISRPTLQAYTEDSARKHCRQQQRDKLTAREKTLLELEVKKDLRKRSLPKLQMVEVAWDLSSGQVRLFSTAKGAAEAFEQLFEKTFETKLAETGMLRVLASSGLTEAELAHLSLLEPERFHTIRA